MSSTKKLQNVSQIQDCGTMQSTWKTALNPNLLKPMLSLQKNTKCRKNSSRKTSRKDIFTDQSHQWPFHFFFITKKGKGKTRPTQDYRYLNDWMIKNAYLMPWADAVVDMVQSMEGKYFTKFNVTKAFNNIRIKEGDQWKGAFKTHYGLYELTVMFFEMCNSPAMFQSMMDHIFKDEIYNKWIIVYYEWHFNFLKNKRRSQTTKQVQLFLGFGNFY